MRPTAEKIFGSGIDFLPSGKYSIALRLNQRFAYLTLFDPFPGGTHVAPLPSIIHSPSNLHLFSFFSNQKMGFQNERSLSFRNQNIFGSDCRKHGRKSGFEKRAGLFAAHDTDRNGTGVMVKMIFSINKIKIMIYWITILSFQLVFPQKSRYISRMKNSKCGT